MPSNEEDRLPDFLGQMRERGDGYSAPDEDYFNGMAERSLKTAKAPARVRLIGQRWFAVAASVLVLLLAGWWLLPAASTTGFTVDETVVRSSEELLAEIDPDLIGDYVNEEIDEFTLELYAEAPLKD